MEKRRLSRRDLTAKLELLRRRIAALRRHLLMFDRLKIDKRLQEHDDALARVDRRLTALEVQWMDTLDRLKQMMGRVLKERQRAEHARGEAQPEQMELSDEDVGAGHTNLNQRQAAINERILARRNRTGGMQ